MSQLLINRSPDLKRLRDEGYEIEVRSNHLLVHSVPYMNAKGVVARGTLVSPLTLAGDVTTRPTDHIAYFIGEHPCRNDKTLIPQIKHQSNRSQLATDVCIDHSFSNKPVEGYANYYEKMTRYIEIISSYAIFFDPTLTARTFKVVESKESSSPFVYVDTASSRSGIGAISEKLALSKIAIVGLGGTGSYILDLLAKTPVKEIHLFDGDVFLQHNSFRSPGAASLDDLLAQPSKVQYFKNTYSKMHKNIIAHEGFVTEANVNNLEGFDFVFLSIDKGAVKKLIIEELQKNRIPFIDVGMGIEVSEDSGALLGICRVTTNSALKSDHILKRISLSDAADDGVYGSNIQVADLNALNAVLAVIKWKKLYGFYHDMELEHHSTYSTNVNQLLSEELA
jgi:hypothetical protein